MGNYNAQTKGKREVKYYTFILIALLLVALALELTAILTTNIVEYKYKTESGILIEKKLGLWSICKQKDGGDDNCDITLGMEHFYDTVAVKDVKILSFISLCMYLNSIIGVIIVAIRVKVPVMTALSAASVFVSAGTLIAGLGVLTWRIEKELNGKTSEEFITYSSAASITYLWGFMIIWIAAGLKSLVFIGLLLILCFQRRMPDDAISDAKSQLPGPAEPGSYNIGFKPDPYSSKDRRQMHQLAVTSNDDFKDIHYSFDKNTFKIDEPAPFQPAVLPINSDNSPAQSSSGSAREIQLKEDMFYRPNPPTTELFKHQETIELRPRLIHQPTPFLEDIPPEYPVDGVNVRTHTISQIVPASQAEKGGLPLDIGDMYVVSLNT